MSTIISGGKFKGRKIQTPQGELTRPTSNKIRQALFNIIGQNLNGVHFFDIYSGSGSVGLEALSRGAESCTFVESSIDALKALDLNIKALELSNQATVLNQDCFDYLLKQYQPANNGFIFIDPPFSPEFPDLSSILAILKGEIVIQYPSYDQSCQKTLNLKQAKKIKKYGVSSLAYFDIIGV